MGKHSRALPTQDQVVVIPPNADRGQDMVLAPVNTPPGESRGSKFKSFFKRSKKDKIILSEKDARILAQVKRRAKILDTGLNLGVAKVGLDPIIGLVPVLGDAVTMFLAMQVIYTAQKADIPKSLTQKMLFNVAVDFGLGLVPVLGDFADFVFKANDRNAKLFEEFLYERAAAQAAEREAQEARGVHLATPRAAAGTGSNVPPPPPIRSPAPTHSQNQYNHNNAADSSSGRGFFGGRSHNDQTVIQMDQRTVPVK